MSLKTAFNRAAPSAPTSPASILQEKRGRELLSLLKKHSSTLNHAKIRSILKYNPSLTVTTVNGETALHIAAGRGHTHLIQTLIKHGANIEKTDHAGWTPLMHASLNHPDTVKELLQHGANVDAKGSTGMTSLKIAQQKERKDIIQILADAKLNKLSDELKHGLDKKIKRPIKKTFKK